ncbi:MAG TPA: PQQ-dependent sugar dehydrogenase, partial [Pyrinomonadaceae bacterium]|nr:PQQ-dependent sugar dehydrogenase [Pyrinomonadaceae bacterium]
MKRLLFLIPLGFVLACGSAPPGRGAGEIESAEGNSIQFRVETVVSGLEVPWSIAFAPDGRMFITERPGRVRVFETGKLRPQPVAVIEDVRSASESGLMGLVLHPQFATNRLLYLSYAYAGEGGQLVRVVRFRETGDALTERTVIIENIPDAPN